MGVITIRFNGKIPSKKNRLIRWSNGRIGPSSSSRAEMNALVLQAKEQYKGEPLEHPRMTWSFGVRSRAQDRDNVKTTLLDVLIEAGVLRDDNFMRCDGLEVTLPSTRIAKGETPWAEVVLW